jgi:hypothetical protein
MQVVALRHVSCPLRQPTTLEASEPLADGWNELVCYARQPFIDRAHLMLFL